MAPEDATAHETLTVEEAADVLRVGRRAVYKAVEVGQLPVLRVGRLLRIPRAALQRLLEEPPASDARPRSATEGGQPRGV